MSKLRYVQCGDYLIPDLTLNAKDYPPLGKYGRMRERYLREHRHLLYSTMLLGGRLDDHLHEIDDAAQKRMDQMMRQMASAAGITVSSASVTVSGRRSTASMIWLRLRSTALCSKNSPSR